ADAPSLMPELLPAVIVPPSRNAGLSLASASDEVSARGCSSRATTTGSPFRCGIEMGTIWLSNRPPSIAATAFCFDFSAQSSCTDQTDTQLSVTLSDPPPACRDFLGGHAHLVRVVHGGERRVDEPPAERRVVQLALAPIEGR